jgi:hypothetical protein
MANKKSWSATPPKKIKPTVPGSTLSMLKEKADQLIDDVMFLKSVSDQLIGK